MARLELEHDELPYPNGWFAVAFSRDLEVGEVKTVHCCGEELVLFRSRSGAPHILDAWCPHLGAHLGEGGRVVGEGLRCPFHGWQWDGESGRCTRIPYCEKIPPRARTRAWEVVERNALILVWRHEEQKPPEWEVPRLEEFESPGWAPPRTFELTLDVCAQDMHENNNDAVHFQYVHGAPEPPASELEYFGGGRGYRIRNHYDIETGRDPLHLTLVRDSFGIGLTTVRWEGLPGGSVLMFSSTTPVEPEQSTSRWVLTAPESIVDHVGEEFMNRLTTGVMEDLPIWKHKVHRARPLLCEADGHLAEFRRWARQFYSQPVG